MCSDYIQTYRTNYIAKSPYFCDWYFPNSLKICKSNNTYIDTSEVT